ncbi:hypothetical protein [Pseudoduganella sp. OTU4001]|uniref:hypothetical protein n=1 Tax=Pseudoduganella sp. OTU4001 TaxID=3043854 RepID=UPI00313C565D
MKRLYLASGGAAGETRAIALAFRRLPGDAETGHWERLCAVANALQEDLGLPAPAVSISGDGAYGLWLSLEKPLPEQHAQEFAKLLYAAYCPEAEQPATALGNALALPPFLHQSSGKWAAFIHPGMGASFAGDEGLEMQPPEAGQLALLDGLESIGGEQLAQAEARLRPAAPAQSPAPATAQDGLLLKDATLEDIVKFLHSKNIEPTFRFLM